MRFPLMIVAACCCSMALGAQQAGLASGVRVRVQHSSRCCSSPQSGTLISVSADSLVLVNPDSGAVVALPRSAVQSIETSRRVGAHALVGAGLGLVSGAAVGAAVGYNCSNSPLPPPYQAFHQGCWRAAKTTIGGVEGGLLGLVVGTVVGAFVPHERWEPTALPEQLGRALNIPWSRRAVPLTFSVAF